MIYQSAPSSGKRQMVALFCVLTFSCAVAQEPQAPVPAPSVPVVSLVSGSCPAVHAGDSISLDWNPGFEPAWPVTGLRDISMVFAGLSPDGAVVNPRAKLYLPRGVDQRITSIGNGFFHIEIAVPRHATPGIYQLTEAHANALTVPEFKEGRPQPIVSPAREHLCMTVIAARPRPSPHS